MIKTPYAFQTLILFLLIALSCNQQSKDPKIIPLENKVLTPVAETPSKATTSDGKFISWKEHLIDDPSISGIPISGSDGLVMADLDLDGYEDIVSVHESDTEYDGIAKGHIRIAFGSADPNQWELVTLAEGEEAGAAEDVSIADANGDGYPDIIAACELAHLIYFQNPGENIRTTRWERLIPEITKDRGSFIRVFFADFNQDGQPEVVTPNKGKQSPGQEEPLNPISWFEINGDPLDQASWIEHELTRVIIPINAEPVDLDQDGDLDIVGGSRGEGRIFWFENLGTEEIKFKEHAIQLKGTAIPNDKKTPKYHKIEGTITTGFNMEYYDMNQDGRLDILLTENIFTCLVWLEQPAEPHTPWQLHPIGEMLPDLLCGFTLGDINGDGHPDIMSGSYSRVSRDKDPEIKFDDPLGRLSWFEHPGDIRKPWIRHDISRRKRGMFDKFLARDMDKDGDLDFVSTRGNSLPYDGVFWLEQVRNPYPKAAFESAREKDSEEVTLSPL